MDNIDDNDEIIFRYMHSEKSFHSKKLQNFCVYYDIRHQRVNALGNVTIVIVILQVHLEKM